MNEMQLLRLIAELEWVEVKGMVPPKAQAIVLDVVFHTAKGSVTITGKDHIVQSGEEAFSLAIYEYVQAGWWAEKETNWSPINFKEQWAAMSLSCLMVGPRHLQFYSDPKLSERAVPMEALLDSCSAIEFVKAAEGENKRLVIKASDNNPCAIEIGIGAAGERLLTGLKSIAIVKNGDILGSF